MKKRVSLFDLILGEEYDFSLEERILNAILFSSLIAGLLSLITDLLLSLDPSVFLMTLSGTIILLVLYFFSRRKYNTRLVFTVYSVLLVFVVVYLWYANGGMLGAALVFFMPMTFLIPMFLKGSTRIIVFVLLLSIGGGLLIFEISHPGFVTIPESDQVRMTDAFFASIFVSVSVLLIATLVLHSYQKEHQKVKNLNASKDKVLSIIAHDLINPMGTSRGLAKILSDKHMTMPPERRDRLISNLLKSAEETYNLLDNLLLWGKSEYGLNKAKKEQVDVYDLIKNAVSVHKEALQEKSLNLVMDVENDLKVWVDKNMLATSIRNLLSNAIKFTSEAKKISINAFEDKELNKVTIIIEDEGVGMEQSTLDQLFKKDSFITTKGTNNEEGTGFGLKITKEFVELNDGLILVESVLNQGTRFVIRLDKEGK